MRDNGLTLLAILGIAIFVFLIALAGEWRTNKYIEAKPSYARITCIDGQLHASLFNDHDNQVGLVIVPKSYCAKEKKQAL